MTTIYPFIMCGGSGTRLWPLSRKKTPKQYQAIVTERSMLRETIARHTSTDDFTMASPSFVAGLTHRNIILEECEAESVKAQNIILEPCARNTAPVAIIAALEMMEKDPEGLILLIPSDHHIEDQAAFMKAIAKGVPSAVSGQLTTFGIQPTRPDTGYGYIHAGAERGDGSVNVNAFVEKPDEKTAKDYVEDGNYFWNAGIFLFSPRTMVEAFKAHAADILSDARAAWTSAKRDGQSIYLDPQAFSDCRDESIDYAIMEHASNVAMVCPVTIGWSDIGSWQALRDRAIQMGKENEEIGDVVALGCSGSYIRSEGPFVAAIGLEDIVIVAMDDAVLVTRSNKSQDVKKIVNGLKTDGKSGLF